jgi:hypothetical protein
MMTLALLIAAAQPAEDPAVFIRRIYAGYAQSGYSPLIEPEKLFSPKLTAAIHKDSSGGEVGYLNGDPLCDCQDFESISAQILSISRPNSRSANARVYVTLGPNAVRDLKIRLILTRDGWRIADIVDPRGHSLSRELHRSNAKR